MSYRELLEQRLKVYSNNLLRVAIFPVMFLLVLGALVASTLILNPIDDGLVEQKMCTDSIEVDSGRYGGTSNRCVSYDEIHVPLEEVVRGHVIKAAIVAISSGLIWIWYSRGKSNILKSNILRMQHEKEKG